MKYFSSELRARRIDMGLSLRDLEARMNSEVAYSMLSRYERGIRIGEMSVEHAQAISKAFRWSMDDISKRIKLETSMEEQ